MSAKAKCIQYLTRKAKASARQRGEGKRCLSGGVRNGETLELGAARSKRDVGRQAAGAMRTWARSRLLHEA
jgi:hypothetical protein